MHPGSPWLALVTLPAERLPDLEQVGEILAREFSEQAPPELASGTDNGVTFRWGSINGNYTLVDRPIPWERLEGPCATAWYWPEAEATLRTHTQHLFLTLLDDDKKPIHTATRMTRLVAALAIAAGGTGIVWGPSGQVHRTEDFAKLAAVISPEDLPLHLWIDFRVAQHEDSDALSLFTTGLEALGHREFEAPYYAGDSQRLAGTAYNLAHYVLEKGPILKDGEAVGLPDGGQVNVNLGPSMIDPDQEVVQLTFDS